MCLAYQICWRKRKRQGLPSLAFSMPISEVAYASISSPPLCWRCDSKYIISYPYTHSNINIVKNKKKYFKQKKKRKNACHFQFL